MKRLIEFPLEDGSSILVEVDENESAGGIVDAAAHGDVIEKAHQTFESAMDKVKPAASAIIAKIRTLHDAPDEVEVQFGLKLSAEAGAFVAAAGVEANYSITLKWKKEEKKPSQ